MSKNLVIIPTYNESENITNILDKVFGLDEPFEVLVVDDNSPDGTAGLVKNYRNETGHRLYLLERAGKEGLGKAYIAGFNWALERDYQFIFEMDADFSHDPHDLPRLLKPCRDEGYDIAVGSRYVTGVNVVNWPIARVLMSYFASVYVRWVTGLPIYDTTAGFKCYRREVLQAIDLKRVRFKGYAFQIEMKFTAWKMGFKLKEVPIIFTDRTEGESKMTGGIFNEAVFGILKMKWKSFFKNYSIPDNKGLEEDKKENF